MNFDINSRLKRSLNNIGFRLNTYYIIRNIHIQLF